MTKNFFLVVDFIKGYDDIFTLDEHKMIVEKRKLFYYTHSGLQELYSFLENFFNEHRETKIYAGFEFTGEYKNNRIHFLIQY